MRRASIFTLLSTDLFMVGLIFGDDTTRIILAICCALVVRPIYVAIRDAAHERGVQAGYDAAWEDVRSICASGKPLASVLPSAPESDPQALRVGRR